jgi:hypothetical protein
MNVEVDTEREQVELAHLRDTGRVWSSAGWVGIPGSFLEVRFIPGKGDPVQFLGWSHIYGPTQEAMGAVEFELTAGGRTILNIVVLPKDRAAGDIVADTHLINLGLVQVRWGLQTPPAPPKPKVKTTFPYGDASDAKPYQPGLTDEELPTMDLIKELRAEGWSEEEIVDMLFNPGGSKAFDEADDSYTPKSAQPKKPNQHPDRWDEDE